MKIRKATEADIPVLLAEAHSFIKECANPFVKADPEHLIKLGRALMKEHVFVVAEADNGEVAGFIGACYNKSIVDMSCMTLQELFWWVLPAYRKTKAAWLLIKFISKVGDKYGIPVVLCTTANSPEMDKSLTRQGFNLLEKHYIRGPECLPQ
jgi:hypothetical protein